MSINPLDPLIRKIEQFTLIDVRSPSEFLKGHIPTAINIPLFSDEERKIIGTTYKKLGKRAAIEEGLSFVDLKKLINQIKNIDKPLLLYCARGGMRSSSVSWLFKLLEYDVTTIVGGYKSFRGWVLEQFQKKYDLIVIGGQTGVGKTEILHSLKSSLDLEKLANHKGSAFGEFDKIQPSQEQFENELAFSLFFFDDKKIFVEDESRFIGNLRVPDQLYNQIRSSKTIVLTDLIQNRINRSILDYKNHKQEDLAHAIKMLEKKLGSKATKEALLYLENKNYQECCSILFSYYDKRYNISLNKRDPKSLSYLDISTKTKEQITALLEGIDL